MNDNKSSSAPPHAEDVAKIINRVVEQGLPAVTPATITDEEVLRDELADTRDRGFTLNREENIEGLHAVGVPVQLHDGTGDRWPLHFWPTHRLKGEYHLDSLLDLPLGTTNELEETSTIYVPSRSSMGALNRE